MAPKHPSLTRETRENREAAARWARHRSNEGFLLGKSCHVSLSCHSPTLEFCPDCSHKVAQCSYVLLHVRSTAVLAVL